MPKQYIRGTKNFTPEYQLWVNLRRHKKFLVCAKWQRYFMSFLEDVGLRPSPKYILRRYPNKEGLYEPGNTRWELRARIKTPKIKKGHGMSHTPEYRAWNHMKQRCLNSNHSLWESYGALGVEVYEEWQKSFKKFFEYIGPRPSPKHSLDRYPNPYGHYEPGNVRWATSKEQSLNRRQDIDILRKDMERVQELGRKLF